MAALQQLLADRQRVIFLNLKVPRSWEAGDNAVIQKWVPEVRQRGPHQLER